MERHGLMMSPDRDARMKICYILSILGEVAVLRWRLMAMSLSKWRNRPNRTTEYTNAGCDQHLV